MPHKKKKDTRKPSEILRDKIIAREGTPESNIRKPSRGGREEVVTRFTDRKGKVTREETSFAGPTKVATEADRREEARQRQESSAARVLAVTDRARGGGTPPTTQQAPTTLIGRAFETIKEAFTISAQTFIDPFTGQEVTTNSINALQVLGIFGTAGAARGGVGLFSREAPASLKTAAAGIKGKTTIAQVLKMTGTPIAVNTATKTITHKMLIKAGFTVAAALFIGAVTSYPFADFLNVSEAVNQTIGGARWQAVKSGNIEMVEALNQLQDEILNPTGWDRVWANTPYVNIIQANKNIVKAAIASTKVYDKIIEDLQIQQETGETEDAKWERIRQEETDQKKENVDYYNEQRKQMVRWEQEARAAARKDDARFWADQAAKQRKLEEADRQAIADFWLAYRKRAQELADDNRPSNLNFGLL